MSKGPRWSEDSVKSMLMVLRSKLEALVDMSDERMDRECGSRLELEKYIGKSRQIKLLALQDWTWGHATGVSVEIVDKVQAQPKGPVVLDDELEKVLKLMKERGGSATDGGIEKHVFEGDVELSKLVIEHGITSGKIKKVKMASGMEVITST